MESEKLASIAKPFDDVKEACNPMKLKWADLISCASLNVTRQSDELHASCNAIMTTDKFGCPECSLANAMIRSASRYYSRISGRLGVTNHRRKCYLMPL